MRTLPHELHVQLAPTHKQLWLLKPSSHSYFHIMSNYHFAYTFLDTIKTVSDEITEFRVIAESVIFGE